MTEKEKFKLIERTCKHDAYQKIWIYARGFLKSEPERGSGCWYAREKMNGHAEWLKEQPYRYLYTTQDFVPNEDYNGE